MDCIEESLQFPLVFQQIHAFQSHQSYMSNKSDNNGRMVEIMEILSFYTIKLDILKVYEKNYWAFSMCSNNLPVPTATSSNGVSATITGTFKLSENN